MGCASYTYSYLTSKAYTGNYTETFRSTADDGHHAVLAWGGGPVTGRHHDKHVCTRGVTIDDEPQARRLTD